VIVLYFRLYYPHSYNIYIMTGQKKYKYTALVAVDASKQAEKAFQWYLDNCYLPGHRVILIHGIQAPKFSAFTDYMVHDAVISDLKDRSYAIQEKYAKILQDKKMPGKFMAKIEKSPHEWIARVAKNSKVDLVVMGTKGFDKLTKSVMSSVSNCLIEQGDDAVAVYPGNHVLLPREGNTPIIVM